MLLIVTPKKWSVHYFEEAQYWQNFVSTIRREILSTVHYKVHPKKAWTKKLINQTIYWAGCTCPKQKCCTCPKSKCCTCTTIVYWCCTCPKCYCCTCMTLKQLLWLLPDSLLVPVALVQHNLKVLHMTFSKTAGVALAWHLQKRANCGVYSCPITQMV